MGAGALVLCLLPVIAAARPAPALRVDAAQLRDLMLASASRPYQGVSDSTGGIQLPPVAELNDVGDLFSATTCRSWYASPSAWRVAMVQPTGERDVFRAGERTYVWDFERNLLTEINGELPIRLPWAADVTPPELARRLLHIMAPDDPVTALPGRRVAGLAAAGLRLSPADPETTIGRVDIWADPRTGLPVRVEIGGRDGGESVLATRFLELRQQAPDAGVLAPPDPLSAGLTVTSAPDVAARVNSVVPGPLPASLAGKPRSALAGLVGVGVYGSGLSSFLVVPLPGRVGSRTVNAIHAANPAPVPMTGAEAYEVRASVLSTLVVRTAGSRQNRRTYLLAGFVGGDLLRRAAAELAAPVR